MLSHNRLISLNLCRRIDSFMAIPTPLYHWWRPKIRLDAIVNRKIDGPSRKITKNGGSQTAIKPSKTVLSKNFLDGLYINHEEPKVRFTLSLATSVKEDRPNIPRVP